jgi:hypothetical protein
MPIRPGGHNVRLGFDSTLSLTRLSLMSAMSLKYKDFMLTQDLSFSPNSNNQNIGIGNKS